MSNGKPYVIAKKEEIRRISQTGEPITLLRIWATSKGGTYFHIEVAEDKLSTAHDLLAAKAQEIDAI